MILKLHLLFSLYMLGLIWFVQIVHYPLMAKVPKDAFVAYEQAHTSKTFWVTAFPMLFELITGVWLCWQPPFVTDFWYWNLAGIMALWASTIFIQIPLHSRLSKVHSIDNIQRLVNSNWIRTVIWSLRAIGLIFLLN